MPFRKLVHEFCKQYEFEIDEDNLQELTTEDNALESSIYEGLFVVFGDHGEVGFAETGSSAMEGVQQAALMFLELAELDSWHVDTLKEQSKIVIKLSNQAGEHCEIVTDQDPSCDWLSPDLFIQLNRFAQREGEKSVMCMPYDDPYRLVPMSHEAYEKLKLIVNSHSAKVGS